MLRRGVHAARADGFRRAWRQVFEHHGVAPRIFAEAYLMPGCETPELGEVEIDDRKTRLDKAALVASGLDLYHGFYGGHLYAEALRHIDIILLGKDVGDIVAADRVGECQRSGVGRAYHIVGLTARASGGDLRREQESGGYHQFFHFT